MRIVKHAKHSLHTGKNKRVTDKQFHEEQRNGETVCGYWLADNFRKYTTWYGYMHTKKIQIARCVRRVTCKHCLRNARVKEALKKMETKP